MLVLVWPLVIGNKVPSLNLLTEKLPNYGNWALVTMQYKQRESLA